MVVAACCGRGSGRLPAKLRMPCACGVFACGVYACGVRTSTQRAAAGMDAVTGSVPRDNHIHQIMGFGSWRWSFARVNVPQRRSQHAYHTFTANEGVLAVEAIEASTPFCAQPRLDVSGSRRGIIPSSVMRTD